MAKAVKNINEKISEALIGMDPTLQSQIDQAMIDLDKTEKKVVVFLLNPNNSNCLLEACNRWFTSLCRCLLHSRMQMLLLEENLFLDILSL